MDREMRNIYIEFSEASRRFDRGIERLAAVEKRLGTLEEVLPSNISEINMDIFNACKRITLLEAEDAITMDTRLYAWLKRHDKELKILRTDVENRALKPTTFKASDFTPPRVVGYKCNACKNTGGGVEVKGCIAIDLDELDYAPRGCLVGDVRTTPDWQPLNAAELKEALKGGE